MEEEEGRRDGGREGRGDGGRRGGKRWRRKKMSQRQPAVSRVHSYNSKKVPQFGADFHECLKALGGSNLASNFDKSRKKKHEK